MRSLPLLPLLASAALAFAQPAAAYTVIGLVECPDVTAGENDPVTAAAHTSWILGYMSARNYAEDASSGDGMPDGVMYGMLLQFCVDNPTADIDDAGQFIFDGLK